MLLQIEVALHGDGRRCAQALEQHLRDNYISLAQDTALECDWPVESVRIVSSSGPIVRLEDAELQIHMYQLRDAVQSILHEEQALASAMLLPAASLGITMIYHSSLC